MKKLILIAALILFFSVPAFGFQYISLLQTENNMLVSIDAYFGTWLPLWNISYYGAEGTVELKIMDNLFIGGGAGLDIVSWNLSDYYTYSGRGIYLTLSGYAKYYILTAEQAKELIGLPFVLGAAAGVGFDLGLVSIDFTANDFGTISFIDNYQYPFNILAVGIVGYQLELFGQLTTISLIAGWEDNTFGYSVEIWYPLEGGSYINLYWVPLLGIGGSFTFAI